MDKNDLNLWKFEFINKYRKLNKNEKEWFARMLFSVLEYGRPPLKNDVLTLLPLKMMRLGDDD